MQDFILNNMQGCLDCGAIKPLEQGIATVRDGAYVEFICNSCKVAN